MVADRLWNEAARRRAHADDVHRRLALSRHGQRIRDVAAPGLAVGDHDEGFPVRRLAKQLFVGLDELQAPIQAFFDVGVPRWIVFEPERRMLAEMIEEEKQRVGIFSQARLRRGEMSEDRQRDAVPLPTERLCERPDELNGSLPAVRRHVLDPHRRGAVLQDHDVGAGLGDR